MEVALIKSLAAIAGGLSEPAARRLGAGMAWFARAVLRYRREYLLETLQRCLPDQSDAERRELVRKIYRHFGYTAVEFLRALRQPPDDVVETVRVEGDCHWRDAKEQGRGLLGLTGHIGNWELMGAASATFGYDYHVVVRHLHNEKVDAYLREARERMGLKLLSARRAYRECLRILRAEGNVVMVLDQNMHRDRGVFVQFFGRTACTTPGLALLSAQTQAPVLPAYMIRGDDGTHTLRFLPWMAPPPDRRPETIREATQSYTRVLEDIIRRHPDQWIWFHHRWRTRPLDELEKETDAR